MTTPVKIRRYTKGDEKAIQSLINSIMKKEFGQDRTAYPTEDLHDIQTNYGALGEAFFVAVDGKQVVGTVAVKKEDDRVALLRRLFVDGAYRRRKIGVELVDQALYFCQEVGYEEVVLRTTSRMHQAIRFCQNRGFIQRAKIQLGPVELLKFVLSVKDGKVAA